MENYILETAGITKITDHINLWDKCFPGDRDFARKFFDNLSNCLGTVKATDSGGRLIGQIILIPCNIIHERKAHQAYYGYAVCTDPDFQGRGICRRMHEHLFSKIPNINYYLHPANESLASYYQRLGLRTMMKFCEIIIDNKEKGCGKNNNAANFKATPISFKEYGKLRERCLSYDGSVQYDERVLDFMLNEISEATDTNAIKICLNGTEYITLSRSTGKTLIIEEFLPHKFEDVSTLLYPAESDGFNSVNVRYLIPEKSFAAHDNIKESVKTAVMGTGINVSYMNLFME